MPKKPKIIIRLELLSHKKESEGVEKLLFLLPKPTNYHLIGEKRILTDGREFPSPNVKTIITYEYQYNEHDIGVCNDQFLHMWLPYKDSMLSIILTFHYQVILNYEITVYDHHYPALIFQKEILHLISDLNAELSFYYYND